MLRVRRTDHQTALLLIAITVCGGCESTVRHVMVDAPNRHRPVERVKLDGPATLKLLGVDQQLAVQVGPPEAMIRLSIIEPRLGEGNVEAPVRGVVFIIHGIWNEGFWQLSRAKRLADHGYRVVVVDQRGHGESTGRYITYGAVESRDMMQVLDALQARGLAGDRAGVFGFSMGAATAIQWAGRDERVNAVVALAPYASMKQIVPHLVRRALPLSGAWLSDERLGELVGEVAAEAGFDPAEADTVAAAAKTKAPILLLHGKWDAICPVEHGRQIITAAPEGSQMTELDATGHLTGEADLFGHVGKGAIEWFDEHLAEKKD